MKKINEFVNRLCFALCLPRNEAIKELKRLHSDILDAIPEAGFAGMSLLNGLLGVVVILLVMAYSIPVLWPLVVTASANITSMSGTDGGTTIMKALFPVSMLFAGLAVGIGLIVYSLKEMNIMS